jgi:hypothetical protein
MVVPGRIVSGIPQGLPSLQSQGESSIVVLRTTSSPLPIDNLTWARQYLFEYRQGIAPGQPAPMRLLRRRSMNENITDRNREFVFHLDNSRLRNLDLAGMR